MKTSGSILFILLVAGAFFAGRFIQTTRTETNQIRDTLVRRDTLRDTLLVVRNNRIIHYDTIVVRRTDTVTLARATDSLGVVLPVERRTYQTAHYRAVISGIRPRLDEMEIFRNDTLVSSISPLPARIKRNRWDWTIGIQAGYGITPAGKQPYLGIGVTAGYTF